MIDYKALADRLKAHAECHSNVEPHDDEQRQWADDLRTVVTLLEGMADQELVGWIITNGIEVPLYLPPAPQPRPEPVMAVPLDVARNAVEHVGMANYAGRQREAESWLREAEFEAFTHPAPQPRPERQPVSEPTDRCKHGVRFPHECRECEAEPSIEKIQRWRESEGLTEREPQPHPIDPHMIVAEDRYPDEPEPTEAQIEAAMLTIRAELGVGFLSYSAERNLAGAVLRAALAAKEQQ